MDDSTQINNLAYAIIYLLMFFINVLGTCSWIYLYTSGRLTSPFILILVFLCWITAISCFILICDKIYIILTNNHENN